MTPRMETQCPQCGEIEVRRAVRVPVHFSLGFCMFGLLGGAVGGLFWALGQQRSYECGRCDFRFFAHTRVSRIFFGLAVAVYTFAFSLIGYAVVEAIFR